MFVPFKALVSVAFVPFLSSCSSSPKYLDAQGKFDRRAALAADDAAAVAKNQPNVKPDKKEFDFVTSNTCKVGGHVFVKDLSSCKVLSYYSEKGLLSKGLLGPTDPYSGLNSPLFVAVARGLPVLVSGLLKAGLPPDQKVWRGRERVTPLYVAVEKFEKYYGNGKESYARELGDRYYRIIESLLNYGANPNFSVSKTGNSTALSLFDEGKWTRGYGKTRKTEFGKKVLTLLKKRGGFESKDRFAKVDIFLWAAIEAGDLAAAKQAVNKGAAIESSPPYDKYLFPVIRAVQLNRLDILKYLKSKGAKLNKLFFVSGEDLGTVGGGFLSLIDIHSRSAEQGPGAVEMQSYLASNVTSTAQQKAASRAKWEKQQEQNRKHDLKEKRQKAHNAAVKKWMIENMRRMAMQDAAARARAYAPSASDKRIKLMNSFIDAYNKGAGNKVYQRYSPSGNYQWYRKSDKKY